MFVFYFIGGEGMSIVDAIEKLTDNFVAIILTVAGVYLLINGNEDGKWLVGMGVSYIWGKSTPMIRVRKLGE